MLHVLGLQHLAHVLEQVTVGNDGQKHNMVVLYKKRPRAIGRPVHTNFRPSGIAVALGPLDHLLRACKLIATWTTDPEHRNLNARTTDKVSSMALALCYSLCTHWKWE